MRIFNGPSRWSGGGSANACWCVVAGFFFFPYFLPPIVHRSANSMQRDYCWVRLWSGSLCGFFTGWSFSCSWSESKAAEIEKNHAFVYNFRTNSLNGFCYRMLLKRSLERLLDSRKGTSQSSCKARFARSNNEHISNEISRVNSIGFSVSMHTPIGVTVVIVTKLVVLIAYFPLEIQNWIQLDKWHLISVM